MAETLEKLRPDRDLQCYFERPSAIAALSGASASGFTVSGTWRQQFDWAVIEWNRDNVFEHPAFRYLPDGDLSGLRLSYEETRDNCVPLDSDLYPTVDWPYLRVWATSEGAETLYKVRLKDYATPIEGSYNCAAAEFELGGTPTTGDYVGIAWSGEHHTYQLYGTDTIESVVAALVASVNAFSPIVHASQQDRRIKLYYTGPGQTIADSTTGANGNRFGAYTFVAGAGTESWVQAWAQFAGGTSPTKWRIELDFSSLRDIEGRLVPANAIRKMRWTYAADLEPGAYERGEFRAQVSNWTVTGTNRAYSVAGRASQRIEDDAPAVTYLGNWASAKGNFSGGSIHHTTSPSSSVTCVYRASQNHTLYLGTRLAYSGAQIAALVDGQPAIIRSLLIPGEDVLARLPLGEYGAGEHSVTITHQGAAGSYFYFDFLEAAVKSGELPTADVESKLTLATDWDTDHSIALPPERTAWILHSLGFRGRANHYVGALWFYELVRPGHQYASATVDFIGAPEPNQITEITFGRTDQPPENHTTIQHLNLIGDTAETLARAFALEINRGYTAIRAEAEGARLTIWSRGMGSDGNKITLAASPTSLAQASGPTLTGGADGNWRTDLAASPRLNRAVRDWSRSYYTALKNYGIEAAAAFSMELQHGDPGAAAGIAQRYPSGAAVLLNTPALQTNFSPTSLAYWKEVYREMAALAAEAGHVPFLQFGEVQWWYFPDASGMPFYDDYTRGQFQALYDHPMQVIPSNTAPPSQYPEETAFLPTLVGGFTSAIVTHVRQSLPTCRFEVLYPPDVNETALNRAVNYPDAQWTPQGLDCLKTESFTYTAQHNLDLSRGSMTFPVSLGFPASKRSHLVGIGDSAAAWLREARMAEGDGVESVVLFALDQFCLIGYAIPLRSGLRRSAYMG